MRLHLKIWIPAIISLWAYSVASSLSQNSDPTTQSYSGMWYVIWGLFQLVAAWYTYKLLKIKNRSGSWVGLVAFFGLLGVAIIYLIPKKKVPESPNDQV